MSRFADTLQELAAAEHELQFANKAIRAMQDNVGKLRAAWDVVLDRFGHGLAGNDPGCKCIWCKCDRALQELEK